MNRERSANAVSIATKSRGSFIGVGEPPRSKSELDARAKAHARAGPVPEALVGGVEGGICGLSDSVVTIVEESAMNVLPSRPSPR